MADEADGAGAAGEDGGERGGEVGRVAAATESEGDEEVFEAGGIERGDAGEGKVFGGDGGFEFDAFGDGAGEGDDELIDGEGDTGVVGGEGEFLEGGIAGGEVAEEGGDEGFLDVPIEAGGGAAGGARAVKRSLAMAPARPPLRFWDFRDRVRSPLKALVPVPAAAPGWTLATILSSSSLAPMALRRRRRCGRAGR